MMMVVVFLQASSLVAAGLGLAAIGFIGRYVARNAPVMSSKMNEVVKNLPKLDLEVKKI